MSSPTLEIEPAATTGAELEDEDIVLAVHNVSKHYKLWASPTVRLRYSVLSQAHRSLRKVLPTEAAPLRAIQRRRDALYQDFTALHELSFEVRRGESLGILGRNGAGKSTLLQIIAGTLQPSTGSVDVYGRIAALLELGSGFNLEYTGRENVYLNAAVLGFSKADVDAKFDSIAAFADIGRFLDQPVKTYSSGMLVRLAFSVQMAVDPAIFIIDEALAVGDIYFQNKCNKLLRRKLDDGLTLLLVSHSPGSIRSLCQRGLVLDRGKQAFLGPSDEAVNIYFALGDRRRDGSLEPAELPLVSADKSPAATAEDASLIPQGLGQIQDEIGTREIVITGCELFNAAGKPCHEFTPGEPIRAGFTFRSRQPIQELMIGFAIRDKFNNVVSARTSVNQGLQIAPLEEDRLYAVFLTLQGRLGAGEYLLDLGLGCMPDTAGSPTSSYHRVGGITFFGVSWDRRDVKFQGICDLDGTFELPPSLQSPVAPQDLAR
jgi:lipopolysaccharide transport system ATP-binding protein